MMNAISLRGLLVLLVACSDTSGPVSPGTVDGGPDDARVERPDGTVDASVPSTDWCDRILASAGESASLVVGLSEVHALHRHFGTGGQYSEVDEALAVALSDALEPSVMVRYAAAWDGVCDLGPVEAPLPDAAITTEGTLAIASPGRGTITVPAEIDVLVVDVRGVPEFPELRAQLGALIGAAHSEPVFAPRRRVRRHIGAVDEIFARDPNQALYRTSIALRPDEALPSGTTDRTLVFVTGAELAPSAAELIVGLRAEQNAWLAGASVFTAVAEADIRGVAGRTVAVRTRELISRGGERYPDVLLPDTSATTPAELLAAFADRSEIPPPRFEDQNVRSSFPEVRPLEDRQPATLDFGRYRAALLTTHGILRWFYPYFDTVGDQIDERLEEVVAAVSEAEATDRAKFLERLGRLTHALDDGHVFLYDFAGPPLASVPPFYVDFAGADAVVDSSVAPELRPGDTLVELGGIDVATRMSELLDFTSASTLGYRRDLAYRKLSRQATAPTISVRVRGVDGMLREVSVAAVPIEQAGAVFAGSFLRRSGFLADLGAPDVFYLNLDGGVADLFPEDRPVGALLTQALGARALIVDMRGYPGAGGFDVLPRLAGGTAVSPAFRVPTYLGPDDPGSDDSDWTLTGADPYRGQMYLLVGPRSVSAAETIGQTLRAAASPTIVGRTTAGTNGNITGTELIGGFGFSFTGMEVRNQDGSVHHAVGLIPDIEVPLSPADLAAGVDSDIQAALEDLGS
ncbi:MAG: S41 family peptidase [Myxococcota bacterium]